MASTASIPRGGAASEGTLNGAVESDAASARVHIEAREAARFDAVFADGTSLAIDLKRAESLPGGAVRLSLLVDGRRETVIVTRKSEGELTLDAGGVHRTLVLQGGKRRAPLAHAGSMGSAAASAALATLLAPMPARIAEVLAGEGSVVEEGQPLLRIEAMKMVMTLSAPARRRIATLHVAPGDNVDAGRVLVTFADAPDVTDTPDTGA